MLLSPIPLLEGILIQTSQVREMGGGTQRQMALERFLSEEPAGAGEMVQWLTVLSVQA